MAKKKRKKLNEFQKIEKEIDRDIKDVEKWVIQRRKFLIKLAWVVGLIAFLLIFSEIYLKVKGVGV